ncbi:MAG: hypothetical protein AB1817_00275 [Chloroflexota bacterium]
MKPAKKAIPYPELLQAIGQFIAKRGIGNICIMEYEDGVIVTGSALYDTGETIGRRTETHVLTGEDLRRLVKGG